MYSVISTVMTLHEMIQIERILEADERDWAWLARRLGISKSLITRWKKGERKITEKHKKAMADLFHLPKDILFPNGSKTVPIATDREAEPIDV